MNAIPQSRHDRAPSPDPVIPLITQRAALCWFGEEIGNRTIALRASMVKKYGEPKRDQTAESLWENDSDYTRLSRMTEEDDRLINDATDVTQLVLSTNATSMEGVLAKVRMALYEWPGKTFGNEHFVPEIHEQIAFAVLEDVERFLVAALAPEQPQAGSAFTGADPDTARPAATEGA